MSLKAIWILCAALALGGFALGAAGCGGGDTTTVTVTTQAEDTPDDAMTETDTSMTGTTMTETETTDDGTETDATSTDTTENSDLSFATSENCQEFVKSATALSDALSGTGDQDLQEVADAMQDFAEQAPEDIKDDFETLADAYSKLADALDGVDTSSSTPDPKALAKLQQLMTELDMTKLGEAGTNILLGLGDQELHERLASDT